MKTKSWMAMIALSLTLFFVACDDDDDENITPTPTLDQADINFLNRISQSHRAVVILGQAAQDSGTNPAVQQYGQQMIADNQQAQRSVDSIASIYQLTLPTTTDTAHVMFRDSLLRMVRGRDFDTSYVGYQIRLHEQVLQELNSAAGDVKNEGVKSFISGRLPIVTTYKAAADSLFGAL
jgi:putative membrane protein